MGVHAGLRLVPSQSEFERVPHCSWLSTMQAYNFRRHILVQKHMECRSTFTAA